MRYVAMAAMLWAGTGLAQGHRAPLEIKGIQIGMTEKAIRDEWKREQCQDSSDFTLGDRVCLLFRPTFAGVPTTGINAGLYADRVETIYVGGIDASDFSEVVAALIAKYGEPAEDVPSVVQNQTGVEFDNRTVRWFDAAGSRLQATKRGSRVSESTVMLMSANVEALHEERSKRGALEATDDL